VACAAEAVFAVVVTRTVVVTVGLVLKSATPSLRVSPVLTWQELFGALVEQLKYTRPLPGLAFRLNVVEATEPATALRGAGVTAMGGATIEDL